MWHFMCCWKHWKVYLFFSLKKVWKKYDDESFSKSYLLRFIDGTRFMKASLCTFINNLGDNIYNRKCKPCMKCKDCKKCEECKDDSLE